VISSDMVRLANSCFINLKFPGEIASLLSEKNKSRDEIIADCILAVETVHFNVAFVTTFRRWGISLSDEKTKRMTNRLLTF
jgi:hypothetical protein